MSNPYKTVAELCSEYRLGKTKAYELINSGAFRTKKVGTKTLIETRSIDEWVDTLPSHNDTRVTEGGRYE